MNGATCIYSMEIYSATVGAIRKIKTQILHGAALKLLFLTFSDLFCHPVLHRSSLT